MRRIPTGPGGLGNPLVWPRAPDSPALEMECRLWSPSAGPGASDLPSRELGLLIRRMGLLRVPGSAKGLRGLMVGKGSWQGL